MAVTSSNAPQQSGSSQQDFPFPVDMFLGKVSQHRLEVRIENHPKVETAYADARKVRVRLAFPHSMDDEVETFVNQQIEEVQIHGR